jgi:thiol-disulfide isomerase/thioredoxin
MKKIIFSAALLLSFLQTAVLSENSVRAYYFYSPDCEKCVTVKQLISDLQKKYPLEIKYFNIDDKNNYASLIQLEKKYKIKNKEFPEIFIGDSVLAGKNEIKSKLEGIVKETYGRGGSDWPDNVKVDAEATILERFKSFGPLAVILAGLIDGINPCAFATIVFFISFLTFAGKRKREILLTGIFFTVAVFITYLLIGLGAFKLIRSLEIFAWISRAINYGVGILALALGTLSIYDYYKFKRGKTAEIALQLPKRIKQTIHTLIRQNANASNLAITALATGFLVSILESICTGQVYLPTIVFMLKTPGLRAQSLSYLLLYNFMFILPLMLVFGVTFFGATSEWFGKIMNKNLGLIKILTALLFFGLAALLFIQ